MGRGEQRLGMVMGGGATSDAFHFATLDLDDADAQPVTAALTFLAHGVCESASDSDTLLLFEKQGPGACALHLQSGQVTTTLTTKPGRQFYGHGAFSPDGSLLYCTESDLDDQHRGYLAVRDGKDFRYLGDMKTHGRAPHDCILRPDGTMVVTNGGGPSSETDEDAAPCVTHVEVATGKLLRREVIPAQQINAGHLAMTRDGALAVSSAPREGLDKEGPGGLCLRTAGGELERVTQPREITDLMVGETLSVAIDERRGVVAATNPLGHLLSFWDLNTGKLRGKLRVPNPRGVALCLGGDEFVVTFGVTAKVSRLSAETLAPVDAPGNRDGRVCAISGSHIFLR